MSPATAPQNDDSAGFTLIELTVAMLISMIVLAVVGSALISLSRTALRNDGTVTEEQTASGVLQQLATDIRSSDSIAFPSPYPNETGTGTSLDAGDVVVLTVNGQTNPIVWIYDPGAQTLIRYQLVQSAGASCTPSAFATSASTMATCLQESGPSIRYSTTGGLRQARVTNPSVDPLFTYYSYKSSTPLSPWTPAQPTSNQVADDSTVASCTTRISVDLYVSPPSGVTGVAQYQQTADVAITDRLVLLTTPGNGQC